MTLYLESSVYLQTPLFANNTINLSGSVKSNNLEGIRVTLGCCSLSH